MKDFDDTPDASPNHLVDSVDTLIPESDLHGRYLSLKAYFL